MKFIVNDELAVKDPIQAYLCHKMDSNFMNKFDGWCRNHGPKFIEISDSLTNHKIMKKLNKGLECEFDPKL